MHPQDLEVRRRYSEFASLRDALTRLHPTLIIPPIPEKHTMADYAAKPTSAKQDQQIIDLRKRMLAVFLNRCRRMDAVRTDGVWWRFLDPNASWVCLIAPYLRPYTDEALAERGAQLSSCLFHSQVHNESTTTGCCQPDRCALVSARSVVFCEAQGYGGSIS